MGRATKKRQGRKAWLVLWESWHGEGEYLEKLNLPAFVCVLPPNLGNPSVVLILKTLWAMWAKSLEDKIACGSNPCFPKDWIQDHGWRGPIMLGYDPFLTAQRVENLRVLKNASGEEDLHFVFPEERGLTGKIIPARSLVLRHGQRSLEVVEEERQSRKGESPKPD